MKQAQFQAAQDILGERLREVFGPDLDGIIGYGAGLDRTQGPERSPSGIALNVSVDSAAAARRAEKLPKVIDGLPVKVERRALARAG